MNPASEYAKVPAADPTSPMKDDHMKSSNNNDEGKDGKSSSIPPPAAGGTKDGPILSPKDIRSANVRKTLAAIIESSPWSVMMTFITIWTLFQTDIKYAATGKEADSGFEAIGSIFFFLY